MSLSKTDARFLKDYEKSFDAGLRVTVKVFEKHYGPVIAKEVKRLCGEGKQMQMGMALSLAHGLQANSLVEKGAKRKSTTNLKLVRKGR